MRLYTAEVGHDAFHGGPDGDSARLWGYVPKPVVSLRYGQHLRHYVGSKLGDVYEVLPDCDPHKRTLAQAYLDYKIPKMKVSDDTWGCMWSVG